MAVGAFNDGLARLILTQAGIGYLPFMNRQYSIATHIDLSAKILGDKLAD